MVDNRLWWQSRPASEVIKDRKPFLHPGVIKRLAGIVTPEMTVMEHGSGGSTLWFEDHCKTVVSVERDLKWVNEVKGASRGSRTKIMHWVEPSVPRGVEIVLPVDLLLIDGEPLEVRCVWLFEAAKLVKPGGWVVLDNANREIYARERQALIDAYPTDYFSFNGNEGITKYLVTDFWRIPLESRTQPVIRRRRAAKVK